MLKITEIPITAYVERNIVIELNIDVPSFSAHFILYAAFKIQDVRGYNEYSESFFQMIVDY